MKKLYLSILLSSTFFLADAQIDLTTLFSPNGFTEVIEDPITNSRWKSVCFNVNSDRDLMIRSSRKCANVEFLSKENSKEWSLQMRLRIRTDLDEWPLSSEAFLILNHKKFPISLGDVQSKIYHIKDEDQRVDTSGMVITDISTRDFQFFRKEVDLTEIFEDVKLVDALYLVLYSGEKPWIFKFDNNDMDEIQSILK